MNKQQAQEIIRETFENPFDKERFTKFIRDFLNHFDADTFIHRGYNIPDSYDEYISSWQRLGKYSDGENRVDILIVNLKKEASLERARSRQRNFVAGYLQGKYGRSSEKEAALVAYVSPGKEDWRFSLVKMDYRFDERGKVKEEFTPARRWSFLVGANEKSHTAQSRLVNILANDEQNPTLKEIEKAFDIETVTKEFFLEYRKLFLRTKEELDRVVENDPKIKADFEAKGVDTVNFAKKLLGQIVFLYFLQKKGWFGVGRNDDWGAGSKHFLRKLFEKKHAGYNNFFNDILEPLFYEALRIDRSHDDDYYSRFDCKIPFLNGGLFDPIGNYDWVHTDVIIPDRLFSNFEKTKEGDTGTGILDVFDRYNFTVKEDEPLEKEVAIDPELLGKAYEKFNAIRPDNFDDFKKALKSGKTGEENKFNKKFGVYYTPREIVHYMCQQSLINYLATESSLFPSPLRGEGGGEGENNPPTRDDIETLIHTGEQVGENEARVEAKGRETDTYSYKLPESVRQNAKLIDDKLASIKVCDPAIGSGAFPVGMMHEIVKTRNVLSAYICHSRENGNPEDKSRSIYNFKRECIEKSLYGVDIDPGAIEIAKLRLWLSLVVDEEEYQTIKPLPNLDYKIMQGNSLIEDFHGISLDVERKKEAQISLSVENNKLDRLIEDLHQKQIALFNATHPSDKKQKKEEVENAILDIFHYELQRQKEPYFKELRKINETVSRVLKEKEDQQKDYEAAKARLDKRYNFDFEAVENELREMTHGNKKRSFFPWKLYFADVFRQKGGFDVVIANPPYDVVADFKYRKLYGESVYGRMNLYGLFIHKTLENILKQNGYLAFINPKTLLADKYFRNLRRFMKEHGNFKSVLKISNRRNIFENVLQACIVYIFEKQQESFQEFIQIQEIKERSDIGREENYFFVNSKKVWLDNRFDFCLLCSDKKEIYLIFDKIYLTTFSFKDIGIVFATGKIQWDLFRNKLVEEPTERSIRLIWAENVQKYCFASSDQRKGREYIDGELSIEPNITTKTIVTQRTTADEQEWRIIATIFDPNKEGFVAFSENHTNFLQEIPNGLSIEFIQALLSSKLFDVIFRHINSNTQVSSGELNSMPIKKVSLDDQQPFITLVNQILSLKKSNPQADTSALEAEIDRLVYDLYGLTEEEIAIVEGNVRR